LSWAFQVADFVEKSLVSVYTQQKESIISMQGRGISWINWNRSSGKWLLNLVESHCLILTSGKVTGSRSNLETKLSSEHEEYVQKLIDLPFPTFQRIFCLIKGLSRIRHFHIQELDCLELEFWRIDLENHISYSKIF